MSRLIAGSGYVSDAARQAVERAIEELGYRPRPAREEGLGAGVLRDARLYRLAALVHHHEVGRGQPALIPAAGRQ